MALLSSETIGLEMVGCHSAQPGRLVNGREAPLWHHRCRMEKTRQDALSAVPMGKALHRPSVK